MAYVESIQDSRTAIMASIFGRGIGLTSRIGRGHVGFVVLLFGLVGVMRSRMEVDAAIK